jgi:AraC-like DNA-binding protein
MNAAEELRFHLTEAYRSLGQALSPLRIPRPQRFEPRPSPGGPAEGHFHLRPELFLQVQGSTRFVFPSESLDLGAGEALIVPPRVYHAETALDGEQPFLNLVLYADGGALSCHQAERGPEGLPRVAYPECVEGPFCAQVGSWLEDAVRVWNEMEASEEIAQSLLGSALGMAIRLLDLPAALSEKEPLVVARSRRMIHEGLGDPSLSVSSIAQALGCNADYLSHLFRSVRGEKLTEYVDELRMERAAELLARTGLSCKEVAWASGYANQSYFIRRFRVRWGLSPSDYRLSPSSASFDGGFSPRASQGGALDPRGRSP